MQVVTFDFHNTLFHCDAWFRLEIEDLPVAVMRHLDIGSTNGTSPSTFDLALRYYLEIRDETMRTGIECDAVTSIQLVFDRLGLNVDAETIDTAVRHVMWDTVHEARPLDGAIDLLSDIHRAGVKLAVVSSAAYHPFLEWCLERFKMRSMFDRVVTSAECGIYKTDPRIYQHTLDLFAVPAHEAIHIGDSYRFDVASASSIGMKTILLTDEPTNDLDPPPDTVITSLGEARPHLDKLLVLRS